jgi:hypothetical protein
MTKNQLLKKLKHLQIEDYQDLLFEILDKFPVVAKNMEIKFGFVDESKIVEKYKTKILKELGKKWVDSHGWDGDDIYYKYKPAKAKEYIKEFNSVCINKKWVLELMFFYFLEYTKTIYLKEENYHVLQTVRGGRDQVFVDICKYIQKYNQASLWSQQLLECLETTKRSIYLLSPTGGKAEFMYPLESELKDILAITREQLLEIIDK